MKNPDAIWLVAGGTMQQPAAQYIKSRGFKLILSDGNKNCYLHDDADFFVHADIFDVPTHLNAAKEIRQLYSVVAVVTAASDCHETVANLARLLNVHGIDPEISKICRYKNLTREVLQNSGIPGPRFMVTDSLKDANTFAAELKCDFVVKATNNSGSRGFSYLRAGKIIDDDQFSRAVTNGTTGKALVEEALIPNSKMISEQSVETLWHNGKMYFLNWVDRIFVEDLDKIDSALRAHYPGVNAGIEIGHVNPAVHSDLVLYETISLIKSAGLAIGMGGQKGSHILKADMMQTTRGPAIIELTPRLSGGWDSGKTTPARGANFVGGMIELALGRELDLDLWMEFFAFKNPANLAAIMAEVLEGSLDCIGRRFAIGVGTNRAAVIMDAFAKAKQKEFLV